MLIRNATFPGRVPPGAWVTGAPAVAAEASTPPPMSIADEVFAFIARHKMSERRFNTGAGTSTDFVAKLRDGSQPKPKTVARLREFMRRFDAAPDADRGRR